MKTFENWCLLNDVAPIPAAPATVAQFVATIAPLGIAQVWPIVQEISRAYYTKGLADPTLSGTVCAAINEIARIDPPRSWPREHKARFLQLPYDLQAYVSARENDRDKAVKRAQSEAGKLRHALKREIEADGDHSNAAA
jgi:hypothetical protein